MPPVDEETTDLREELTNIVNKIKEKQEAVRDDVSLGGPGSKYVSDVLLSVWSCKIFLFCRPGKASTKKLLKGHINKVTCVHFSGDSRYCIIVSSMIVS